MSSSNQKDSHTAAGKTEDVESFEPASGVNVPGIQAATNQRNLLLALAAGLAVGVGYFKGGPQAASAGQPGPTATSAAFDDLVASELPAIRGYVDGLRC